MSFQLRDLRYNDIHLTFHEEGHKYNDSLGNEYKSMTTLLHEYQPKFEKDYWLKKKAKELHTTTAKLAKQWQDITDEACARGTKTHNGLEDGIKNSSMFKDAVNYMRRANGEMITVADLPDINTFVKPLDIKEFIDATENKYPQIYDVFKFYLDRGYTIYSEIGAFLIDYLISGTIDVLLLRDDQFIIGDWKTNRGGLKFESGYYKKDKKQTPAQETDQFVVTKDTLLPPVNHMPSCNGSIYTLQLSGYAKMVELILGIPCAGLWLCHIDSDFVLNEYGMPRRFPDGLYHVKQNPNPTTTFHKIIYHRREIEAILNDRRKVIQASRIQSKTLFD